MLILTRKECESLYLMLDTSVPLGLTAHELFAKGPIIITYRELLDSGNIRIGISAPNEVVVLREELLDKADTVTVSGAHREEFR